MLRDEPSEISGWLPWRRAVPALSSQHDTPEPQPSLSAELLTPVFKHSEAFSFQIATDTQEVETILQNRGLCRARHKPHSFRIVSTERESRGWRPGEAWRMPTTRSATTRPTRPAAGKRSGQARCPGGIEMPSQQVSAGRDQARFRALLQRVLKGSGGADEGRRPTGVDREDSGNSAS